MRLESHTMRNKGGYDGYDCVVIHDDGTKETVIAYPRQHAGIDAITKAAIVALSDKATAERESKIEKAEEIMAQVRTEKEEDHIGTDTGVDPDANLEVVSSDDPPPVFEEEEYDLKEPTPEDPLPEHLAGYKIPEGKPDTSWLKGEIQRYLFQEKISYEETMTKAQLLKKI